MEQNYYDALTAFSFEKRREMNKISLDTFAFDKHNNFEYSADKIIQKLKTENLKSLKAYKSLSSVLNKTPANSKEKNEESELRLMQEIHHHFIDMTYQEDELFAFSEMKIIYAFKHLEINIKRLVNCAYPTTSTKGFYRWDNFMEFLNVKSIIPQTLAGIKEINQLRIVNNALKHSREVDENSSKIPEFKGKANFSSVDLCDFYERIKPFPIKFLGSLANAISDELYLFNEKRLNNMAVSVALRMGKEHIQKFLQILQSYY